MKRKNGFTLIEVLGVIILLGILSVIVVPVVRDNIKKSKIKAYDKQVDTILTTAKEWAADNTSALTEGSFLVKVETLKKKGLLENKEIINPVNNEKMKGCAKVSYNQEFNQYEYEYLDSCMEGQILTAEDDCINDGKGICNPGTLVNVQVNDSKNYNFYVISDDGNELTMIMDRNLGDKVSWYTDEDDTTNNEENNLGPITALNYLNIQTKSWNNIPTIENYTYENSPNASTYGYQKLVITNGKGKLISKDGQVITEIIGESRARLLTHNEATSAEIGCKTSSRSCQSWLYGNLSSSNTTENPYGYWLLTTELVSYMRENSWSIYFSGMVNSTKLYNANYGGIRPVIIVPKNINIY